MGEMKELWVEERRKSKTRRRNGLVHGGTMHEEAVAAHVLGQTINNSRHPGKQIRLGEVPTDLRRADTNIWKHSGVGNEEIVVAAPQERRPQEGCHDQKRLMPR